MLWSAIGSTDPEEPPGRDVVRLEIQFRAEVMAYLAGNRHHGYRTDCLQQKRLVSESAFAVPATDGNDPTISLNRDRGERGCSFKVVGDQACRGGSSSKSHGNSIDSFHFDSWMVLDGLSMKVSRSCWDVVVVVD